MINWYWFGFGVVIGFGIVAPAIDELIEKVIDGDLWTTRSGQGLCERLGHRDVIWFRSHGNSPDMRCSRCLKDIG